MNVKNKVALAIVSVWSAFFVMIMFTQIMDESLPAKYLFRTFLVATVTPALFLWITDTWKPLLNMFKRGDK